MKTQHMLQELFGCQECDSKTQHSMGKSLCNSTMEPTLPKAAWTMNLWAEEG